MDEREAKLGELSSRQHGLVTRAQLLSAGFSSSAIDRRLANGDFELLFPRVYRLRGTPLTQCQQLLGGCLSLGEGTAASGRSAAWLWGLDGFKSPPATHELCVLHGGRRTSDRFRVHQHRGGLPEGYVFKQGVPTTVLARTLLDLAGVLYPTPLEIALDSSARGNPEFFHELHEFLSALPSTGRPGIGRLTRLVALRRYGEATGSPFETDLLQLLRSSKLPPFQLQYPIFETPDRPLTFVDFAFPEHKIALYADGGSIHLARRQAGLDAWQRMKLVALGWRPIVVMPHMIKDPAWIESFARMFPPPPQLELTL